MSVSAPGDEGKVDVGGVEGVVVDLLACFDEISSEAQGLSRVWVDVESGVVAAGDIDPYPVPDLEQVARGVGDHVEPVYPAGFQELRLLPGAVESCPEDGV